MTASHRDARMCWTTLGLRMGFTCTQPQREEILGAIHRMNWVHTPDRPPHLDGRAVHVIVNAVHRHSRDHLRLLGVAQLNGGRHLVGMEDAFGTRNYLLDLDTEAIYVLAVYTHPLATHCQALVA